MHSCLAKYTDLATNSGEKKTNYKGMVGQYRDGEIGRQ